MIDNTQLTKEIASQLKYLPNSKDTSYYKVFRNANLTHQIRVSNHGTYLRTWIDKDYDPSISTNISIVFTKNGVPTNDCLIDSQTNEPFKDCAPCIDQQTQSQQPCKPRQVAGISNKKRIFIVKQYVYNCEYLSIEDVPLLIQSIKQSASSGSFNDPFIDTENKAAKCTELTPIESVKDSINQRYNIIKESKQKNCNRNMKTNKKVVRLTESKLKQMIAESIKGVLMEGKVVNNKGNNIELDPSS